MLRHMRSLRSMRRDNGWIHTLLEEAENERMHLLTFLQLRQPGLILRGMVLLGQVWVLPLLGFCLQGCVDCCPVWYGSLLGFCRQGPVKCCTSTRLK